MCTVNNLRACDPILNVIMTSNIYQSGVTKAISYPTISLVVAGLAACFFVKKTLENGIEAYIRDDIPRFEACKRSALNAAKAVTYLLGIPLSMDIAVKSVEHADLPLVAGAFATGIMLLIATTYLHHQSQKTVKSSEQEIVGRNFCPMEEDDPQEITSTDSDQSSLKSSLIGSLRSSAEVTPYDSPNLTSMIQDSEPDYDPISTEEGTLENPVDFLYPSAKDTDSDDDGTFTPEIPLSRDLEEEVQLQIFQLNMNVRNASFG